MPHAAGRRLGSPCGGATVTGPVGIGETDPSVAPTIDLLSRCSAQCRQARLRWTPGSFDSRISGSEGLVR